MAKGYIIAFYKETRDLDALAAYAALAAPAIQAAGGRFLARGGKVEAYENGLAGRTVVVEFDSFAQASAAYNGAAYQAALAKLGDTVDREVRVLEGMD